MLKGFDYIFILVVRFTVSSVIETLTCQPCRATFVLIGSKTAENEAEKEGKAEEEQIFACPDGVCTTCSVISISTVISRFTN
jgi:hypothetical protein